MKRIVVDPLAPDPAAIAEAVEVLRDHGVVAYPTDTLYGLAVDPRRDLAVRKLFAVKERDHSAAIALIAADPSQAEMIGVFGEAEHKLARAFWPGPLTIIVPSAPGLSRWISGELGTVGVRVPAHPVACALAGAFGFPLTATSANLSGRKAAETADEVAATLEGRIDALIDAGPAPGGPPSTLVEITNDGRPTLRRAGAIAWDRVLESLQ